MQNGRWYVDMAININEINTQIDNLIIHRLVNCTSGL